MKIVVVSDSHRKIEVLKQIVNANPDADIFLHCGDIELPPDYFPQFVVVGGNNDYFGEYPDEKVITVGKHKILMTHSHQYLFHTRVEQLVKKAKRLGCSIVCFGHTHVFLYSQVEDVHVLNPGSCSYPRDMKGPCYAVIEIEEDDVIVSRVSL